MKDVDTWALMEELRAAERAKIGALDKCRIADEERREACERLRAVQTRIEGALRACPE